MRRDPWQAAEAVVLSQVEQEQHHLETVRKARTAESLMHTMIAYKREDVAVAAGGVGFARVEPKRLVPCCG